MKKKEKAIAFFDILKTTYPDAVCSLNYSNPLELLIAVELSAQCTDARVNTVTPILFEKYKSASDLKDASLKDVEEIIRPIGFFRSKAKNIIACSQRICDVFGGKVPDNMDDLLSLAGVGRKTANLILGDIYQKGGMVIDTHAKRILKRVGLTKETEPYKVELDTKDLIPVDLQSEFCHRLVLFGREYCTARKPDCKNCPAKEICPKKI